MEIIKRSDVPISLSNVYFDFHWSQKKLWALELPITQIEIDKLSWIIEYPIWASDPPIKIFDLKPIDVLQQLDLFPKFNSKLLKADTSFPIHIMFWKNRWIVLDGIHRLLKAIINLETIIKVKIVPHNAIIKIQPDTTSPCGFYKFELHKNLQEK